MGQFPSSTHAMAASAGARGGGGHYSGIFNEDSMLASRLDEGLLDSHNNNTHKTAIIQLTPVQSCNLHGWSNPKRTLSWTDVACNAKMTLAKCMEQGITAEQLHEMQPDVRLWIRHKQVSFRDVPLMVCWPLHPVEDLKGDISDLATMRYDARVLRDLGLSYEFMRRFVPYL